MVEGHFLLRTRLAPPPYALTPRPAASQPGLDGEKRPFLAFGPGFRTSASASVWGGGREPTATVVEEGASARALFDLL